MAVPPLFCLPIPPICPGVSEFWFCPTETWFSHSMTRKALQGVPLGSSRFSVIIRSDKQEAMCGNTLSRECLAMFLCPVQGVGAAWRLTCEIQVQPCRWESSWGIHLLPSLPVVEFLPLRVTENSVP